MKKLTLNTKLICILVMIATVLCTFTGCSDAFLTDNQAFVEECKELCDEKGYSETEEQTEISEINSETVISEQTTAYSKTEIITDSIVEELSVEKDGSYTTPEDVAEYIHTFGTLPSNFITKNEAKKLGWVSSEGNLWDVAEGMSIGGDRFGNYEGLLPEGDYKECDVNYYGGFRGSERIVFSDEGIYYTNDHYESFTQLY